MRLSLFVVALLPLALAGCGIPDLVASGVKTYENQPAAKADQGQTAAPPATARPMAPAPASTPAPVPAPSYGGGVPPREPVVVEPLK